MTRSFAEIRRAAPPIHVSGSHKGDVTILEPRDRDVDYEGHRYSENFIEGDGSRENPYSYLSSAPVSPHYATVDLWSRFRDVVVFIKVNDWLLEVNSDGVTALDGVHTKLA